MTTSRLWLSLLAAVTLALMACGGGDDDEGADAPTGSSEATVTGGTTAATGGVTSVPATSTARATQAAASSGGSAGGCEGTISGGVTGSFKSGGGTSAVNTDYWFNESDLLQAAKFLGETESAVKAKLDAKQFVVYPLILNCGDSKTGINFLPKAEAHADFPFGPKTYSVPPGGLFGGQVKNGEVSAIILVNETPYRSKGGTFEVKKFDKSGISGSFTIDIEESFATSGAAKTGKIVGTFDMPCTGANNRSGCAR